MRLPKDINGVCTQHAMLVKGEQIEHGRKRLQLQCGDCVPKDIFQGRAYCPQAQASKGWISPHRAPVWERTLTKVGMGSTAFPYAWKHFQAPPWIQECIHVFRWEGIEVEVTCTQPWTRVFLHLLPTIKSWYQKLHGLQWSHLGCQ